MVERLAVEKSRVKSVFRLAMKPEKPKAVTERSGVRLSPEGFF